MTGNTERDALIAEARQWPRDGVNEGALINALADELEREPVVVDDATVDRAERGFLDAYGWKIPLPSGWRKGVRAAVLAALTPDGQGAGS